MLSVLGVLLDAVITLAGGEPLGIGSEILTDGDDSGGGGSSGGSGIGPGTGTGTVNGGDG